MGALREDGLRRARRHAEPGAARLSYPGLRRRSTQRNLFRRHLRQDRAARRQSARRMRHQLRGAGDSQRRGRRHWRSLHEPAALARAHLRQARLMTAQDRKAVTIVTQTRVEPGKGEDFARWQQRVSEAVAAQPGFVKETVMPPSPPAQVDWVILQRFASRGAAVTWLRSAERQRLVTEAQSMLLGQDDVQLVSDSQPGVLPAPVSAVISTRIKPGQEQAYLQWGRRIAEAQAKSPGFQGYRREPPVPGVQEDWLTILRFDSEANLQTWLDSPERKKLLEESEAFTDECHTRIVRTRLRPMVRGSWRR